MEGAHFSGDECLKGSPEYIFENSFIYVLVNKVRTNTIFKILKYFRLKAFLRKILALICLLILPLNSTMALYSSERIIYARICV
jgi:hypothetical protein